MINGIVFDIETGPLPIEQLAHRMPDFEAPKNTKDPEKIKAAIAKKEDAWIEKAALDAQSGQTLAIGILDHDGQYQVIDRHEFEESEMLGTFWDIVTEFHNTRFIGFNIFNFDLPFLFRRSLVHGIQPSAVLRGARYWDRRFIDLMDVYTCGNRDQRISLNNLCKMLDIEGKGDSGKDFHKWFRDDPAKARQYLKNDLDITAAAAQRLLPWIDGPKDSKPNQIKRLVKEGGAVSTATGGLAPVGEIEIVDLFFDNDGEPVLEFIHNEQINRSKIFKASA